MTRFTPCTSKETLSLHIGEERKEAKPLSKKAITRTRKKGLREGYICPMINNHNWAFSSVTKTLVIHFLICVLPFSTSFAAVHYTVLFPKNIYRAYWLNFEVLPLIFLAIARAIFLYHSSVFPNESLFIQMINIILGFIFLVLMYA